MLTLEMGIFRHKWGKKVLHREDFRGFYPHGCSIYGMRTLRHSKEAQQRCCEAGGKDDP